MYIHTLSPISVSGLSTVRYKTTLNKGSVGRAGATPPTYKLGKFLSWPLALSMSTYSNFQINGASGENRGSGGFRVSLEAPFFGNCYKLTY